MHLKLQMADIKSYVEVSLLLYARLDLLWPVALFSQLTCSCCDV